jgi:hypothetical protein
LSLPHLCSPRSWWFLLTLITLIQCWMILKRAWKNN